MRFLSVMKPWVRWPPSGRLSPMMRSCGFRTAVYTAKLAGEPESGWQLTPHSSEILGS